MSGFCACSPVRSSKDRPLSASVSTAEFRWRKRVLRRVQDHVAGAARTGFGKKPGFGSERIGIGRKRRKIIRIKIDVVVIGHVAGSGIERTPIGRHLRTVLPIG